MKTQNIIFTIVLSLFAFSVTAQSSNTERLVSKNVQKIANKNALSNEHLLSVASVGYPFWTVSKDVQRSGNRFAPGVMPGNMVSGGYPFWIISKGVQRKAMPAKPAPPAPGTPVIREVIAGL